MRLCDETVTVFNARADAGTGGNVWRPTVIAGVSWYATDAAAVDVTRGGLTAAARRVIRIPAEADAGGSAWIDPAGYDGAEDVSRLWTLRPGDIVVRATVTGEGWTPAALKRQYADCATVLSVTDNRRAPRAPHLRAVGGE